MTGNVYDHGNISRYIVLKNPELWLKIHEEQIMQYDKLGRRTSKNFLRHNGSDLVNKVEFYSRFLKLDVIVRKLHGNFKEVYFQFFPKNIYNINIYSFCYKLLKLYPRKKQWELFAETYSRAFGNNILDNLIYLSSDYLSLFPNKTIMNKWAEVHYSEKKSNDMLKYHHPNKAVPLIKEKINVMSDISERNNLVTLLLENCEKNEDLMSLEAVLKYICYRHRNEENIDQILYKIQHLFKLLKFNENHWNYINEMITILKLRKQLDFYSAMPLIVGYIGYLISQEKPFRKELVAFINDVESSGDYSGINLENPNIEKQIIIEILNVYQEVQSTNEAYKFKLINAIIDFNKKYHPEYYITLTNFPTFVTCIKLLLDKKELNYNEKYVINKIINYNFEFPDKPLLVLGEAEIFKIFHFNKNTGDIDSIVKKIITKRNRSKFENDVLQFFWDYLLERPFVSKHVIRWLLINDPKAIVPHMDKLWAVYEKYINAKNIKIIKLLSHLSFDKMVADYCTSKLGPLDDFLKKAYATPMEIDGESARNIDLDIYKTIIQSLSVLLTTSEYIETIVERFLPVKEKIDTADEMLNQIYFLQCEVAKSFRNVEEPALVLPNLMNFCLGDYLQSALPSLYSICYRAPENLLYSSMDVLSKRAVSARKHALFLSCELLCFDYTVNKLQNSNESNISSQKHVFSTTLKYFRKNPSDLLLNLVIINLNTIDKNDEETLNSLVSMKIPNKYKEIYIEKCWYFLESLRKKEVYVQGYLESFFKVLVESEDSLVKFPVSFCRHIITQSFKDNPEKDYYLSDIHYFVCYLLRQKSEQPFNFKFVFDIITTFKDNRSRETIRMFFSSFHDTAVKDINKNNKIDMDNNYYVELFKQHWLNMFTPTEMFDEHVLLNLLYLRCKSSDNHIESYAKEVVVYLEQLVAEYGPYVYYTFKDLVFLRQVFTEKEKYEFFYSVLNFKNTALNCILVIDLLTYQDGSVEVEDIRLKIMEILKSSDQPVVWVYLNKYFGQEI